MIRLYVFTEGETEEAIVDRVLAPHLSVRDVFPVARNLKGRSSWARWHHFMDRQMRQERTGEVYFTTVFDLYRLPKDFPETADARKIADTRRRVEHFERAMAAAFGNPQLIPYIQRHEIEALVLACIDELSQRLPAARKGLEALRAEIGAALPEDVNDGEQTHPSMRLARHVPGYGKVTDGPAAIEAAGLPRIRAACPRFDAWVTKLENLATETP